MDRRGRVMFRVLIALCLASSLSVASTLRRLGSFTIKHPAFSTLYADTDAISAQARYSLIISTFDGISIFGGSDSVQLVRRVGTFMDNINGIVPEVVTNDVTWPNEISAVPGKYPVLSH